MAFDLDQWLGVVEFIQQLLRRRKAPHGKDELAAAARREPVVGQESERKALLALSEATDGPIWRDNLYWRGVTVDSDGRVIGLRLTDSGFRGELPKALRNLHHLKVLDLGGNKLAGAIPEWFGKLQGLEQLRLSNNLLGGKLPESLKNFRHLKALYLSKNMVHGAIPEWLGEFEGLEKLGLSNNSFQGELPEALRKLRHLKVLDLGGNKLAGVIPAWLGELEGLENLRLSNNLFGGELPGALRNLRHLKVLDLSRNGLGGAIPEWFGELESLEELDVSWNSFQGELPEALRNLRHLKAFSLRTNNLEGAIPEWLGELEGLEELYLSFNSFRGELPEALRNLRHVKLLHLWKNKLEGAIPEWLGELEGLEELYLSFNSFRGELPEALRNLRHLKVLDLENNKLEVFPKTTAERLLELKSLSKIHTKNNSWQEPPRAVVNEGLAAIIRYYEAIERSGVRESWMIKVVLVGAVCAGKSSVVASLVARESRPVPLAKRTRGVDVHVEEPFRPGGSKAELVFWDFAGHDDYHSTHSLFLSDGALFLLVVDLARYAHDRSSRSSAIYIWLDALLCRTPGAVVQIIATHTDELGEEHEVQTVVNELRQTVATHLKTKRAEYKRGWKAVVGTGEMPAAPTLRVVYKIHAMSCKTGNDWPELGRAIADLATQGTTENLSFRSETSDRTSGQKDKLFPFMGLAIPTVWARAAAAMDALREGTDRAVAAQLDTPPPSAKEAPVRFLCWEDAVQIWRDIVEKSDFKDEVGADGGTAVLEDAVRLKQSEGVFLLENGLLHLDPTWINELLRAVLDHRLQDPAETGFWEKELEAFADGHPRLHFQHLVKAHRTFCATGTLTESYLQFLWRDVKDMTKEGLFERLLETMLKHGVVFSGSDRSCIDRSVSIGGGSCEALFVPVRLPRYVGETQLKEFSAPCVHNEWRRQLVIRIWQSYIPPGIIGMFMARLLNIEEVQFHCAWSRGISFMMGGSEVLLYLNAPGVGKAEIEINVVGPKRSDEVENKVRKMEAAVTTVLEENFPGLRFHPESVRSIEGQDALMERIDTLEAHLDVRLDEIEGKLDEVAASSRQSLARLKGLQVPNFPYPDLLVVREYTPNSGGNTTGGGRNKRVLSKAVFKSFYTRVRTVGRKEMRLQFLCPYDFSPVPCGPDGEGYAFGKARDWVKKVFPAVQVTAVIAKVALKTVSGLDLPVSEFLNALKEGVGEEVADRALDEDALRRVVQGEGCASAGMQRTSKASYAALVKFMEDNGYDDFKGEMRLVPDGQAGMVWVSAGNVERWERLHSMAPAA